MIVQSPLKFIAATVIKRFYQVTNIFELIVRPAALLFSYYIISVTTNI